MKHLGLLILITIGLVFEGVIIGIAVVSVNDLPQRVSFTFQVPEAFNATSFKYSADFTPRNTGESNSANYLRFPFNLTDSGRVGDSHTVTIHYFGGALTNLVQGSNINELGPYNDLGTQVYHFAVVETDDNRLSTYDGSFFIGVTAISCILWICVLCVVVGSSIE